MFDYNQGGKKTNLISTCVQNIFSKKKKSIKSTRIELKKIKNKIKHLNFPTCDNPNNPLSFHLDYHNHH